MLGGVGGGDRDRPVGAADIGCLGKQPRAAADRDYPADDLDRAGRRRRAGVDRLALDIDRVGLDAEALATGGEVGGDRDGLGTFSRAEFEHRRRRYRGWLPGNPIEVGLGDRGDPRDSRQARARPGGNRHLAPGGHPADIEDEGVATAAAAERVGATAGSQRHRAEGEGGGIERVDPRAARQLSSFDAGERVGCAADQKRGVGETHVGVARLDQRIGAAAADDLVAAGATGERVAARRADEAVLAIAAVEADGGAGNGEGTGIEKVCRGTAGKISRFDGEEGIGLAIDEKDDVRERHVGIAGLDNGIPPRAALERVGARSTGEAVVPPATEKRVVAAAAGKRVAAGSAVKDDASEGECRRVDRVVAVAAGKLGLLDTGERVRLDDGPADRDEARVGEGEVGVAELAERVRAAATVDRVVAGVAGERVVAGATAKDVAAAVADEFHAAEREGACIEGVGGVAADEEGAREPGEFVAADALLGSDSEATVGEGHVGVERLHDNVASSSADERVDAPPAAEDVVLGVAGDRVAEDGADYIADAADRREARRRTRGEVHRHAGGVGRIVEDIVERSRDEPFHPAEGDAADGAGARCRDRPE